MQRYLVFDEISGMLKGFLEVPTITEAEDITVFVGVKIPIEEFPLIAEGTTLQMNSDNTWSVVALVLPAEKILAVEQEV